MEGTQGARGGGRGADTPVAFVDSSAIVTLIDRDDASHQAAVEAYQSLLEARYRLFTTNHVLDEAFELLATGVGAEVARRWLRENRLAIYYVDESDLEAATALLAQRDPAKPMTLTDAISMVVMERLNVTDAFAVDPDFLAELA
jgi:predicted nucleic acid-binding protein